MVSTPSDWFEALSPPSTDDEVLYVDVDGYEGPLDLLLDLARRQKVDLTHISVLALAEQYLAFIETVREKRIEIAADYLVMAAWLAYLKSRLMVPQLPSDDEPSGEMMAALLQFRLKRLEAMRRAALQLTNRPRLGFQVYARGLPEPVTIHRRNLWEASLFDLLKAYAIQRERGAGSRPTRFATQSGRCTGFGQQPAAQVWQCAEQRQAAGGQGRSRRQGHLLSRDFADVVPAECPAGLRIDQSRRRRLRRPQRLIAQARP